MAVHEELLKQLNKTTEECKKLQQIKKVAAELEIVFDLMEKDKTILLIKYKNEAFLTDEEKEIIASNSVKYTTVIQNLRELITEN
jgi:hypothetical protein